MSNYSAIVNLLNKVLACVFDIHTMCYLLSVSGITGNGDIAGSTNYNSNNQGSDGTSGKLLFACVGLYAHISLNIRTV